MRMKFARSWGFRVLAVFLILYGLFPLLHIGFEGQAYFMSVLAAVAGVLILIDM